MADASSLNAAHYRGFFAGWTAFERSWAGLDSAALERVRSLAQRAPCWSRPSSCTGGLSHLDDTAVLQDTMLRAVPELQQRRWNMTDMVRRAAGPTRTTPRFGGAPGRTSSCACSPPPAAVRDRDRSLQ